MYNAIDFPSPLLLFLALFRSLSLSCSLLLSLSLSGGGGGFGPLSRSGFECSPSAFDKKKSIFGLPSDTLSQKMRFRVGHPHVFYLKNEDVPCENASFETTCRKVVQKVHSGDRPRSSYKWRFYFLFFFEKHKKRRITGKAPHAGWQNGDLKNEKHL